MDEKRRLLWFAVGTAGLGVAILGLALWLMEDETQAKGPPSAPTGLTVETR